MDDATYAEDFFSTLPEAARLYAIPAHLGRSELRKRGIHGGEHRAAWERLAAEGGGRIERSVSVFLGDASEVAAIRDGRAVETSAGFSPAEGLPSLTACGDLDPTILFELKADYLDLSDLEELALRRSGIQGYLGTPVTFLGFLSMDACRAETLRGIFSYQILKHIGAQAAILGGLDAIVFIGADDIGVRNLVDGICDGLRFLGVDAGQCPALGNVDWASFARQGSAIRTFFKRPER